MTLSKRLKLSVVISGLLLFLLMGVLLYLVGMDVRGYRHSYSYQQAQVTLSRLSGELWQLNRYEDLQALDKARELTQLLDEQIGFLEKDTQYNPLLTHIKKTNQNLKVLMQLYPSNPGENIETRAMLNARFNTLLLTMQDEMGEIRHRLVEEQFYSKQYLLLLIAVMLFLSMSAVILFNLNTMSVFKRGMLSLESGIKDLAKGNLETRVCEDSGSEFTELSKHFNWMKQELQQITVSRDKLQDEVNKRTEVLQLQKDKLKYEAEHDSLTRVYSRYAFNRLLEQSLKRLARTNGTGALLFIDIDKFKPINDNYGHSIGDHVLVTVAQRISHTLRESDMVARIGGDEFIVWLEPIEHALQLEVVIKKLLDKLHLDINFENVHLLIDVSIGAACYPQDGTTIEALINVADRNMYACKRGDRDTRSARLGSENLADKGSL